jgi:hypothetical protein
MPFIDPDSPTSNPFVGAPALTRPEMGFDISLDIIDIPSTGAVNSRPGHVSMCHVISHTGGGAPTYFIHSFARHSASGTNSHANGIAQSLSSSELL